MSFKSSMRLFKTLQLEDFRVLLAIERGLSKYENIPTKTIISYSHLPTDKALYHIRRSHKNGLIRRLTSPYEGYTLNYLGYDFLALNTFVMAGHITAIGEAIGLGKEADVYKALTPENSDVAIKFHRLGRISFRQTAKCRGYTESKTSWLLRSKVAAEREYAALKKAFDNGVAVPKPIAQNRHAILIDKIEGIRLLYAKSISNPKRVLFNIIKNVTIAYNKAQIIHADLSEYNILLNSSESIRIIDWPQYISTSHPRAEELLKKDIRNISKFFEKFHIKAPVDSILNFVKGSASLEELNIFSNC